MNVAIRDASLEISTPVDPLDHLFGALFHKMGTDGVYARTALYEDMIERLAPLITRLPQELPESARLRLRPAWHRARDPFRGQPLRCRRRLDHVAVAGRSRAVA